MYTTLSFFTGVQDWLIVLAVVLILFGGKKIPELFRGIGQGVGELQKGLEEGKTQFQRSLNETAAPVDPLAEERRKLEEERQKLELEKKQLEEAKAAQTTKIS